MRAWNVDARDALGFSSPAMRQGKLKENEHADA